MSTQDPPKITFPCADYPIKVLGVAEDAYYDAVLEVFEAHAAGFDRQRIRIQPSRNGRFQSITFFIEAQGLEQLSNIFEDLKKHPLTRMVL